MTAARWLTLEDLDCPPTEGGTRRDLDRPTLGPHVEAWHVVLTGTRFMPHQRYVSDVAGELDDDGRRRYDLVIEEPPRQQGKTTRTHANLTASTRRSPGRQAVYSAQDRQAARVKIIDEFADEVLSSNVFLKDRYRARKSNGSESIRWTDQAAARSVISIISNTESAGVGLTKVDDVALDEAWSHGDMTVINALFPTMSVATDPQVVVSSTVGDGTDGLLLHYEEIGAASMHDPDTRVAYFKWAADDDVDPADPREWARFMPALGRTITVDRIRSFQQTMDAASFARAFLNRRPTIAEVSDLDVEAFIACGIHPAGGDLTAAHLEEIHGPVVVAVDIALDRSSTSIAAAYRTILDDLELLAVVVDERPGTLWVPDELARLVGRGNVQAVYADRRAGAGGIIDTATAKGVHVDELTAGDVVSFTGTFVDELTDRRVRHGNQPILTDAAAGARKRPLGDSFAWSKIASTGNVAPLNAASFAVGGHRRLFPVGVAVDRIT